MIVPRFWAESRLQQREKGKQVTVRRFGWSDASAADAQAHADARAGEAMSRVLAGEQLNRRDPKVPYNGAAGLPIREEIVARHGETIVTRNSYGARCLNTPDVLFVDIDFEPRSTLRSGFAVFTVLVALAIAIAWSSASKVTGVVLVVLAMLVAGVVNRALHRIVLALRGGPERIARTRINRFLADHPDWSLRLYRTPAGLRVLVTHRPFAPDDPAVQACFAALDADPVYAAMCRNQQCFRARVSAKPWRIGVPGHMRPRPGVWPVAPERLPLRSAWIEAYERAAASFAACSFIESVGSGSVHAAVRPVQELHDQLCAATSGRPIA
jgi:hypothetical protein